MRSRAIAALLVFSASGADAGCLPGSLAKLMSAERLKIICATEAQMPFKVKGRYLGEGGYYAFESAARKAKRSTVTHEVGVVLSSGAPIGTKAQALKFSQHFERRRQCPVDNIRYSRSGPTFFRVTCSQGDKR